MYYWLRQNDDFASHFSVRTMSARLFRALLVGFACGENAWAASEAASEGTRVATTPNIGLDSAADYLDHRVLPAFRAFSKTPKRASAVEFAVAAWHLHDRLWHERGKPDRRKFVADLMASCPELGLVRDWPTLASITNLIDRL